MTTTSSHHNRLHRRLLTLVLGVLCTACFEKPLVPIDTDTGGSSTAGTNSSTEDADDTMGGTTGTTGTTGPDGCPPAVFGVSRFDEACFQ